MEKRFNITFLGCKSRWTRSRKAWMEGKEGMGVKEREGRRGRNRSYWGVVVITMGYLPSFGTTCWPNRDRIYHYNFVVLFSKLESEEVLTWLRIFSPFPWKITYVLSPQILFEKHTKKEYVLVKHEGHLLLSWELSYSWQFYVLHNHWSTHDLTFVSNANSKSRFCWLVCFAKWMGVFGNWEIFL